MSKRTLFNLLVVVALVLSVVSLALPARVAQARLARYCHQPGIWRRGQFWRNLKNDFIELYNRGTTAVDVTGWTVQYAFPRVHPGQKTALSRAVIEPGKYY